MLRRFAPLVALALLSCGAAPEPEAVVIPPVVAERAVPVVALESPAATIHAHEADVAQWYAVAAWGDAVAQNEREAAEAASRRVSSHPSQGSATSYSGGGVWAAVAQCESGGDWSANTGNGYYGGLQEDMTFWRNYGGLAYAARPDLASASQQIAVAERGLAVQGWRAWPGCARQLGLLP